MGWEGIGTLIGKLSTFIPGRIEKLKNEKARLLNERDKIMSEGYSPNSSKRLTAIHSRVCEINRVIENSAKD